MYPLGRLSCRYLYWSFCHSAVCICEENDAISWHVSSISWLTVPTQIVWIFLLRVGSVFHCFHFTTFKSGTLVAFSVNLAFSVSIPQWGQDRFRHSGSWTFSSLWHSERSSREYLSGMPLKPIPVKAWVLKVTLRHCSQRPVRKLFASTRRMFFGLNLRNSEKDN